VNLGTQLRESLVDEPKGPDEISRLFHKLNNQLGIVLAHAELLEEKAVDETHRQHAARVVSSVLDALGTSREIRRLSDTSGS
jgi:hypothetical protein